MSNEQALGPRGPGHRVSTTQLLTMRRTSAMLLLSSLTPTRATTYGGNFPTKSVNISIADDVAYYNVHEHATTNVFAEKPYLRTK